MGTPGQTVSGNKGSAVLNGTPTEVTKWSIDGKTDENNYASSFTGPDKKSEAGNRQATGTVEGNFLTDVPISDAIEDGDKVALKLYFDGVHYHDIPSALVSNVHYEADIDGGKLESYSFNFTSDGPRSIKP